MTRPGSYRINSACGNCRLVFVKTDYDEGESFYCTFGAPPRPRCGSVGMSESYDGGFCAGEDSERLYMEQSLAWDDWSEHRQVKESGICDEYVALRVASGTI